MIDFPSVRRLSGRSVPAIQVRGLEGAGYVVKKTPRCRIGRCGGTILQERGAPRRGPQKHPRTEPLPISIIDGYPTLTV